MTAQTTLFETAATGLPAPPCARAPGRRAPIDAAERLARLRLARSENVGPRSWTHLIARYGSAAEAVEALPDLAGRGGRRGYVACPEGAAADEMARGDAAGARLVVLGEAAYPARLALIDNAPPVLWMRGRPDCLGLAATAVVGARNASALGLRQARRLARALALEGEVVISGLARGIDTAAHDGALAAGEAAAEGDGRAAGAAGTTAAVLAGGIDVAYPAENAALAERIAAEGGVLVAECPPGTVPAARHFPRRNRLVSGLADGVVLVEAALRSGSLITARTALEQGREVMACPGAAEDPRAGGCNALIRDGACLVRDHRDVLEALAPLRRRGMAEETPDSVPALCPPAVAAAPDSGDGALAARVFDLLGPAPVPVDAVARLCGTTPAGLAVALVELELAGRVEIMAGNAVAARLP